MPALQSIFGDAPPIVVLRGPDRIRPWVARSPKATRLSRASATEGEADSDGGIDAMGTGAEGEVARGFVVVRGFA